MSALPDIDPLDADRALSARGVLAAFNEAGVLTAADIHVATALGTIGRIDDEDVLLAIALAVRGPRLGHVRVDLTTIHDTAAVDADETIDVAALPWPEPESWLEKVRTCPLATTGSGTVRAGEVDARTVPDPSVARPLRLEGAALYLDRYWREERQVARDLLALAGGEVVVDEGVLSEGLARLFGDEVGGKQAAAAAAAVRSRLAVVAGGPGTGKTTTVARIVALLSEQASARGEAPPLVALAAPTGKAAARLKEAVHEAAGQMDVADEVRGHLLGLGASTLHRLLGWKPGSHSRFRHARGNRLPHDVVLVDETSMVSLSLMARLVEAVRSDARLVLVGDPGQLTSIEAGVVLGDIVGAEMPAIVVLDRVHRYGGAIATLSDAIRAGDADAAISALRGPADEVRWLDVDVTDTAAGDALAMLRRRVVGTVRAVVEAARVDAARAALDALGDFRLLCAHRRGPHGVSTWTGRIESWLAEELDRFSTDERWYVGRPLLVTENDHGLRLFNGDTGVVVATGEGEVAAAFDRGGDIVRLRPGRLEAIESVYAMTIHKSQGSQFGTAAVLLPPPTSPILTRELLYTAITRAQKELVVVGTEDTIRAAIARPAQRASGLRDRLRAH